MKRARESKRITNKLIQSCIGGQNTHGPDYYYQLLIESENKYYINPSTDNLEYLVYLYKKGIEFYSINKPDQVTSLFIKMTSTIREHKKYTQRYECRKVLEIIQDKFVEYKFNKENYNIKIQEEFKKIIKQYIINYSGVNKVLREELIQQKEKLTKQINERKRNSNKHKIKKRCKSNVIKTFVDRPSNINLSNKFKEHKRAYSSITGNNRKKKLSQTNLKIRKGYKKVNGDENKMINDYLNKNYYYFKASLVPKIEKVGSIYDQEYREKTEKYLEYIESKFQYELMIKEAKEDNLKEGMNKGINSLNEEIKYDIYNSKKESTNRINKLLNCCDYRGKRKNNNHSNGNMEMGDTIINWFK